jgi:biotin operon repressor
MTQLDPNSLRPPPHGATTPTGTTPRPALRRHMAKTADFRGCIAAANPFRGAANKFSPRARLVADWTARYVAAVVVASLEAPACATIGSMREMSPDLRRQAIGRRLAEDASVPQQRLAAELGCSQSQVQRDVAELRKGGFLPAGNAAGRGRPLRPVTKLQAAAATGAGDELVAKIRAELDSKGLEPDAREAALLMEIRATADIIAAAQQRIDADKLVFAPAAKGGPPRAHPLLAEIRGQRAVLARLLSQISLEEGTTNAAKVKAANTRWRSRQMQREGLSG